MLDELKTYSLKMVSTIICHQSVSVKVSFWLRKLGEEEKKKPQTNKKNPRKKEVKPSNTSHIQDKGGTEFCRELLHWRPYAYREDGHWSVWAVSAHRTREQIQSERKHRIQLWKHQEDKDYWGSDAALNESKEVFLRWILAQKGD